MAINRSARREAQAGQPPQLAASNTGTAADLSTEVKHTDDRERIATRAYEYYVDRGRQDGHDVEDWLEAEQEIRRQNAGRS